MGRYRKRSRIAGSITWIIGILLILACFSPFLRVFRFPFFSLLSLGLPLMILAYLFCLAYKLILNRRGFLLALIPLALTLVVHGPIFHFSQPPAEWPEDELKVMSFNTRAFNKYQWIDSPATSEKIIDFITAEDPDIACFQEFDYPESQKLEQYPYRYVDYPLGEKPRVVLAIISKFPIVNKGTLIFEESVNNAIFADILFNNDTIRVYSVHLESLRLNPNPEGILHEASENKFQRIGQVFKKQEQQVALINAHAAEVAYPKLICGDLNNSPFSNIYRQLKGDLNDAFSVAGSGFGSTYNLVFLPLRIDYIFAAESFSISRHHTYKVELSDHKPIMASMKLSLGN